MARSKEARPHDVMRAAFYSLWGVLTLVLLFGVVFLFIRLSQRESDLDAVASATQAPGTPRDEAPVANQPLVRLYFAHPTELRLVPEDRPLSVGDATLENCRAAIHALIAGPSAGAAPTLPPGAHLRAIYLLDSGELVVDFARDLDVPMLHSAGAEWLLFQSLAHTLTQPGLQGPSDRAVTTLRLLYEGSPAEESFPSHILLAGPLRPDPRLAGG